MSKRLDARHATRQIARSFEDRGRRGHPSDAFFFVVGAGISAPQVPLAEAIERHCRLLLGSDYPEPPADASAMERYSYWLSEAYVQPTDRSEYFRELIEGHPISPANFRLAHLLSHPLAPRLVVTPNFDDFLSRALALFGTPHVVSDHPATAGRINPERPKDVQIMHLHGTYWFYDCCNLTGEIRARAEQEPVHQTVASRLDLILAQRSPLVLGYSGWEEDVFMRALQRRLAAGGLPSLLYWFCYTNEDADGLPSWLLEHDAVRIVAPAARAGRAAAAASQPALPSFQALGPGAELQLPAVAVLDALIDALKVPAPELTRNPVAFFASQLRASLPVAESADAAEPTDVYLLEPMIEGLEQLASRWTPAIEAAASGAGIGAALEQMRDAMRRARYGEAIAAAGRIPFEGRPSSELSELREMAFLAASLSDRDAQRRVGYDLVLAASAALEQVDPKKAADGARLTVMAQLYRAFEPLHEGRYEQALEQYEQIVESYRDDPALREPVAFALVNAGYVLLTVNRPEEAAKRFDEVVRLAGDDPKLAPAAAMALMNLALSLGELGQDGAIRAADELVRRFGDDPEQASSVARSLIGKGLVLLRSGRADEAVAPMTEAMRRCTAAADDEGRLQAMLGLRDTAQALGEGGRADLGLEVLASALELAERGEVTEPMRRELALIRMHRAVLIAQAGRFDEAETAFEDVIERCRGDRDPVVRQQVRVAAGTIKLLQETRMAASDGALSEEGHERLQATAVRAREDLAVSMIEIAQEQAAAGDRTAARNTYSGVVDMFGTDPSPRLRKRVAEARAARARLKH